MVPNVCGSCVEDTTKRVVYVESIKRRGRDIQDAMNWPLESRALQYLKLSIMVLREEKPRELKH